VSNELAQGRINATHRALDVLAEVGRLAANVVPGSV
jgi:hypothetical protein